MAKRNGSGISNQSGSENNQRVAAWRHGINSGEMKQRSRHGISEISK